MKGPTSKGMEGLVSESAERRCQTVENRSESDTHAAGMDQTWIPLASVFVGGKLCRRKLDEAGDYGRSGGQHIPERSEG